MISPKKRGASNDSILACNDALGHPMLEFQTSDSVIIAVVPNSDPPRLIEYCSIAFASVTIPLGFLSPNIFILYNDVHAA